MFELLLQLVCVSVILQTGLCIVSGFGEECNFTAECSDHRMVCAADELNITRCECDRFHLWNGTENGCRQRYDIQTILNMTLKSHDYKGDLENEQKRLFLGQKVAGFFVMSVAFCAPIVVAIHCCHMRKKDRDLKHEVREIKRRAEEAKERKRRFNSGAV